jgi:hypothetical protein
MPVTQARRDAFICTLCGKHPQHAGDSIFYSAVIRPAMLISCNTGGVIKAGVAPAVKPLGAERQMFVCVPCAETIDMTALDAIQPAGDSALRDGPRGPEFPRKAPAKRATY